MARGSAPADGFGGWRAVRRRALPLALGGRPQDYRQPLVRATFLRAEIVPHGASPWSRVSFNAARSIRASLRKRVWSRSSTRYTHRARPVKPSSRARLVKAGG